MSIRRQARDWAEERVREAFNGAFALIREELEWRRTHPCQQALFHKRMTEMLGPGLFAWRVRRRFHRGRLLVWSAKCYADEQSKEGLALCQLSAAVGLDKPTR